MNHYGSYLKMLADFVGGTKSLKRVALVLHRLSQARMGDVIVVAEFAEGIAATLQLAV